MRDRGGEHGLIGNGLRTVTNQPPMIGGHCDEARSDQTGLALRCSLRCLLEDIFDLNGRFPSAWCYAGQEQTRDDPRLIELK